MINPYIKDAAMLASNRRLLTMAKSEKCINCGMAFCASENEILTPQFTEGTQGPYCISCIDTAQEVEDRNTEVED